jgi:hypothetical protein
MLDINALTEADMPAMKAEIERADALKRKLKQWADAKDQEYKDARERDFTERLLGRLFFWSDPSQGIIELVRPTGCTDFSQYGSCHAARLTVWTQGKGHHPYDEIRYKHNDTIRLDLLDGVRRVDVTDDPDLMRIKFDEVLKGYLDGMMKGL